MNGKPEVSVIIPARDEELNIRSCLESIIGQEGPSFEVFVVDDGSKDRTREIAGSFSAVKVLSAAPLKDGWTGKANAIWTALPFATGEWFLFTDADTNHMPGALDRSLREAKEFGVSLLSFSPRQDVGTLWERAVQPIIFSELAHTFSYETINDPASQIAAANGQYILVRRSEYETIGGHSAVKCSMLEDVELAKKIKRVGKIRFRYGPDIVSARMYRDLHSLIEGWTKNLAGLFSNPLKLATCRALEWITLIIVPAAAVGAASFKFFTIAVALGCIALWRYFAFARRLRLGGWVLFENLASLIGLPLFCFLLVRSFRQYSVKHSVTWKGRRYRPN